MNERQASPGSVTPVSSPGASHRCRARCRPGASPRCAQLRCSSALGLVTDCPCMQRVTKRLSNVSWWLEALALAAGVLLAGVYALYSRGNHNEEMYVAAGALLKKHALYSDYAFLQAPLLPLLHAGLFTLSGNEHLLLLARLHTW